MQRAIYCVAAAHGGWLIRLNGKDFGPMPSKDFALGVAVRAAERAYRRGVHTHVMLHEDHRFRTVWINGEHLTSRAA